MRGGDGAPPTLMVRTDSLAEAVRAVPESRWGEWLELDSTSLAVFGTTELSDGLVVELRSEDEEARFARVVAWAEDDSDRGGLARTANGRGIVDGLVRPAIRDALFNAALRGAERSGERIALGFNVTADRSPGAVPASRLIGDGVIEYESVAELTLQRTLRETEPLAVEVLRHLTQSGFKNIPRLLSVLSLRDLDSGVERFWGALFASWPKTVSGMVAFREELDENHLTDRARQLGATLWQLHRALATHLASLRFAPRPVNDEDLEEWREELVETATRAMNSLLRVRNRLELPPDLAGLEEELPARLSEISSAATMLVSKLSAAAGRRARIHGAVDLDAFVRRSDGVFLFVGFERGHDQLESPIRDLASLLHALSLQLPERRRVVRAALLNGYFDEESEQDLVPPTPHRLLSLVQLFELTLAYRDLDARIARENDCVPALRAIHALIGERR